MRQMMRCVSIILVVALLLAVPVCANEEIIPYSSSFFRDYDMYLYKTSSTSTTTRFQVWFDVTTVNTMSEIGASYIEVQRSSDGQNWTVMRTCEPSDYPQMLGYNTISHVNYVSYTGTNGYYYRAYIELYARNSTGHAEWTDYTETIYL